MLLIRAARLTTTWTKAEHRSRHLPEPVFQPGARVRTGLRIDPAPGVDLAIAEETPDAAPLPHTFRFQPPGVERKWALFGLRLSAGEPDAVELWLRDPGFFYGVPRRAEYRLAILRPGRVVRVIHNAKNDFSASSGRDRTYRWNDFVLEPLGRVTSGYQSAAGERPVPLEGAALVDLRENLL